MNCFIILSAGCAAAALACRTLGDDGLVKSYKVGSTPSKNGAGYQSGPSASASSRRTNMHSFLFSEIRLTIRRNEYRQKYKKNIRTIKK